MAANTWPEQDAIDQWWEHNALDLKQRASAYRVQQDKTINRLYEVVLSALDQCESGNAEVAAEILKDALSEFNHKNGK